MLVFKEFTSNRRFGVEYEVTALKYKKEELKNILVDFEIKNGSKRTVVAEMDEKGWAESIGNKYWHVKYDSTCGPLGKKAGKGLDPNYHGWEIASYIGSGDQDIIDISKAASHLAAAGVEVSDNCGLHIHADVSDFSPERMGVVLSRWMNLETFVVQSCPERRHNNKFCKSVRKRLKSFKKYKDGDSLWNALKPTNFNTHENPQKKFMLNPMGYALGQVNQSYSRQTVELRLPECILDEEHVANWLRLYLNFLDYSASQPMANLEQPCKTFEDAFRFLGLENSAEFCILSKPMYDVKTWFLRRICQNSTDSKLVSLARKKLNFITRL